MCIKVTFSFIKFKFQEVLQHSLFIFICTLAKLASLLSWGPRVKWSLDIILARLERRSSQRSEAKVKMFLFSSNLIKLFPRVKHRRITENKKSFQKERHRAKVMISMNYLEAVEVLESLPPDVLEEVVMEVDGLEAVAQVDEGLLVNPLKAGPREVKLLEIPQRRKLDGGQAGDLVLGQDDRVQSLIPVKKFSRKFWNIVVLEVNFTEYLKLGEGILIHSSYFAILQGDFLQVYEAHRTEGVLWQFLDVITIQIENLKDKILVERNIWGLIYWFIWLGARSGFTNTNH